VKQVYHFFLTRSLSLLFSELVFDAALFEDLLAQVLRVEDVLAKLDNLFDPHLVVELCFIAVNCFEEYVFTQVFVDISNCLVLINEWTLEASDVMSPHEQLNCREGAHFLEGGLHVLVRCGNVSVGRHATVLQDAVEDLSLLFGRATTCKHSHTHKGGYSDLLFSQLAFVRLFRESFESV